MKEQEKLKFILKRLREVMYGKNEPLTELQELAFYHEMLLVGGPVDPALIEKWGYKKFLGTWIKCMCEMWGASKKDWDLLDAVFFEEDTDDSKAITYIEMELSHGI